MKLCRDCKKVGRCGKPYCENSNHAEKCHDFEAKKLTYYEAIKKLNIDDMSEFISEIIIENIELIFSIMGIKHKISDEECENMFKTVKRYLESEVKENDRA